MLKLKGREDRINSLGLSKRLVRAESYYNAPIELIKEDGSVIKTSVVSYMFSLRNIELPENIKRIIDENLDDVVMGNNDFIIEGNDEEKLRIAKPYIELLHNAYEKPYSKSYI